MFSSHANRVSESGRRGGPEQKRTSGTLIFIWNLRTDTEGKYELDFEEDPNDFINLRAMSDEPDVRRLSSFLELAFFGSEIPPLNNCAAAELPLLDFRLQRNPFLVRISFVRHGGVGCGRYVLNLMSVWPSTFPDFIDFTLLSLCMMAALTLLIAPWLPSPIIHTACNLNVVCTQVAALLLRHAVPLSHHEDHVAWCQSGAVLRHQAAQGQGVFRFTLPSNSNKTTNYAYA